MEKKETFQGHIMPMHGEITSEDINRFFEGSDPMKHIISIELGYNDDFAEIVYVDDNGTKMITREGFKPFVWAKNSACVRMFDGNKNELRKKMREYGISVKPLYTCREDYPYPHEKLDNGYKYLWQATRKMSMGKFQEFFREAGTPLNARKKASDDASSQEFMQLQPVEQFMIETGKRYFKGYDSYDDLKRMSFDLETEGLNPKKHHISQIGVRTNKGFERIITVLGNTKHEKEDNEFKAIVEFLKIIADEKPDVIFGHNSENFDWDFIITRCQMMGIDFTELSRRFLRDGIYKKKKPTTLKLGGEVETFYQTVIKYHNVVDSIHAVRRAMATDSSFEKANLKYATKYLKLNKANRVYVPGNIIEVTWQVTEPIYAFNDINGDWYKITETKPLKEGYEKVSGKYIVERYLLDDIWECDKVELSLHETDFHLTKIIPTTFQRVSTMGTATQWKLIMLDWAYQNNLAIPRLSAKRRFCGALSRLLSTGYETGIVKLDYSSQHPCSILTWNIRSKTDIMGVMLKMLMYVLTMREVHKVQKTKSENAAEEIYNQMKKLDKCSQEYIKLSGERDVLLADKINHNNQQLVLKKLANSFFGSFGATDLFPFADIDAAENTTCLSRCLLRVLIAWFNRLGYKPIVGDSVTGDTPLFVRYKDSGEIFIMPISDVINDGKVETDYLGRQYDYSSKEFQVLCRSGWCDINYVYRHPSNKRMYRVSNENGCVDVSEDHSLFNENKEEIKPTQIRQDTKLEVSKTDIYTTFNKNGLTTHDASNLNTVVGMLLNKTITSVPKTILNGTIAIKKRFIELVGDGISIENGYSKTTVAGINFIKKCIEINA